MVYIERLKGVEIKKVFIRLASTGKVYTCEPKDSDGKSLRLKANQAVLAEADQILEEGKVIDLPTANFEVEGEEAKIYRVITIDDRAKCRDLKNQARGYIEESQKKVFRHSLDMRILDADLSYDQKKLTFYFCAKSRVDFRGLVLDMVKSFNKIIRLQQVGSRDEAKYFGGIGKCGRELCCAKFLGNLDEINTEMAKNQEISPGGGNKSIGCCGKLMCCLTYEDKVSSRDKNNKKEAKQ